MASFFLALLTHSLWNSSCHSKDTLVFSREAPVAYCLQLASTCHLGKCIMQEVDLQPQIGLQKTMVLDGNQAFEGP
jgi:hypothetical protein